MTQSRSPLLTTKLKVRSARVIESQSLCSHFIVVMDASEQEPFFMSRRPLVATMTLGHMIDCHPR